MEQNVISGPQCAADRDHSLLQDRDAPESGPQRLGAGGLLK